LLLIIISLLGIVKYDDRESREVRFMLFGDLKSKVSSKYFSLCSSSLMILIDHVLLMQNNMYIFKFF
jgi:hypothetical protein